MVFIGWMTEWPGTWTKDVCVLSSSFVLHCAYRPYPFMILNQVLSINLNSFIVSAAQKPYYLCCFLWVRLWDFLFVLPTALVSIDSVKISDLLFPLIVNFIYVPNHSHFSVNNWSYLVIFKLKFPWKVRQWRLEVYSTAWRVWCYFNKAMIKQNCLLLPWMINITLFSLAVISSFCTLLLILWG